MHKKYINRSIIFIFCIVLGVFVSIQFRQDVQFTPLVSLNTIQSLKNEIENEKNEIKNLEQLIDKKREQLKNYKLAASKGNVTEVLKDQVDNIKAIAGFVDLVGPGIIISIEDNNEQKIVGNNVMDDIVHDIDILNIINDLKNAGAEAISIKGQRVLANSEIQCGGPIIWVNKRSMTPPFVIKAIGDPKLLYAAVNAPNTNGDILKRVFKLKIETKISDNILIPKFWDKPNMKYLKSVKEGE